MSSPSRTWRHRTAAVLREPTVHFLVIGALLFVAYRAIVGDPRVVTVTPALEAELQRHFEDNYGREPTAAEMVKEVHTWERDEVLYREALRQQLDRNDRTIRTVLADKVRAQAALGVSLREPSDGDLDAWLAAHRASYERPRRYDYETVKFPKTEAAAAAALAKYQQALAGGADPRTLGRPIVGATLTADELRQRLGPTLAPRIEALPLRQWQRLETPDALLLVRLNAVQGGLPEAHALRPQLRVDWQFADRERRIDAAVQTIVDRYRFVETR